MKRTNYWLPQISCSKLGGGNSALSCCQTKQGKWPEGMESTNLAAFTFFWEHHVWWITCNTVMVPQASTWTCKVNRYIKIKMSLGKRIGKYKWRPMRTHQTSYNVCVFLYLVSSHQCTHHKSATPMAHRYVNTTCEYANSIGSEQWPIFF